MDTSSLSLILIALEALSKAVPPPTTIPSSRAALVANNASSTLSFLSLISISELPPTLIIATPPINLANLSCKTIYQYYTNHN